MIPIERAAQARLRIILVVALLGVSLASPNLLECGTDATSRMKSGAIIMGMAGLAYSLIALSAAVQPATSGASLRLYGTITAPLAGSL